MADQDLSKICLCTEMPLPPDLVEEAAAKAINENPANGVAGGAFVLQDISMKSSDEGNPRPPPRMALPTYKMWLPGRTLRVLMNGGSNLVRGKIQQYGSLWCQYSNLNITFVDSGDAEIRITFTPGGSWSYIGTDNLSISGTQPTMNFGWFTDQTPDSEFSRVVIHEFGHAVGCAHEMQSPAANIPWDKPKVYAYYLQTQGWNQAQVDNNIFNLEPASTTTFSQFDAQSIMMYAVPAQLTTNGFSVGWNTVLSDLDKTFIGLIYPEPLIVLHQGQGNESHLWSTTGSTDLQRWMRDLTISGVGITYGPSAAWFQNKLYVLHEGNRDNHELWCKVLEKNQWLADFRVPNVGISYTPSAITFGNKLFVFHQGINFCGQLWYNAFDGNNWAGDVQVPNTGMSAGPGTVIFQNKLYVFHEGLANSSELWYNVFDGTNWAGDAKVPNTGTSSTPSAVIFNGKIYCFHQGSRNNKELWYNVFDGNNWSGDNRVPNTGISDGPAAIVIGSKIIVFHQGGNSLWYNTFDGSSWLGDRQAPNTGISYSPAVVLRQ